MPETERTFVMLKPDALQRRLAGTVISRFERKGLKIAGMRLLQIDEQLARQMYSVHEGKDFYEPLIRFVTSSPVVAMVLEGVGAISMVRAMMGATFGPDAGLGTIRGDFGASRRHNLVHGSDSPESARREIPLFFDESQLVDYSLNDEDWVYARQGDELI
ncbi:MAG: nucleoside-diphosphate kinase [Phycisphaerae bacterium]